MFDRFRGLRSLRLAALAVLFLAPTSAFSSAADDAVFSILSSYLLQEGPSTVELAPDQLAAEEYVITSGSGLSANFGGQGEDIELCFVLGSNGALQASDLTVQINGQSVAVQPGENCYTLPLASQGTSNDLLVETDLHDVAVVISALGFGPANPVRNTLPLVSRGGWDERAVRKVLKVFAFGGHATDQQILAWADMRPLDAIGEMLNFSEHNPKLSHVRPGDPYPATAIAHGKLTDFLNFLSSRNSDHPIPRDHRDPFGLDGYNFDDGFNRMITVRGMNPFRQRIGFWETNYHLAVNLDASVSREQMARYYDDIMEAHEAGLPYHQVMGVAAKSAAAAMQYGHRYNIWNDNTGECECNDDFAREIHQLYYGIFGEGDPDHEDVTIPETAKLLTDMRVRYIRDVGYPTEVEFGTEDHHVGPVQIFGGMVAGADASAKIDTLMPISMQHPESLQNLPIMIIGTLADDNLDDTRKNQLRAAWASLGQDRNFLEFIQTYAVSDLFHSPDQFKYFTSHERALYMANKHNIDNIEGYFGDGGYNTDGRPGRTVGGVITDDVAGDFFRPLHNVFGGQTSMEASDSALAFENNYNRATGRSGWHELRTTACDNCDGGQPWMKRWQLVLPKRADGQYYVADAAEWLWKHAVGNLDNYTALEQAHLYALLGAAWRFPGNRRDGEHALDFNLLMCVIADYKEDTGATDAEIIQNTATVLDDLLTGWDWSRYCGGWEDSYEQDQIDALNASYTGQQIISSALIQGLLNELGSRTLPLEASGPAHADDGLDLRHNTRSRINSALEFIFSTPFVFGEGGQ